MAAVVYPQFAGSDRAPDAVEPHGGYIVTTIAQLSEPLTRITAGCGPMIKVESMLGSGTDPHLYRLTRADVLKLRNADMIFYVGHKLEAQMEGLLHSLAKTKPVYALGEELEPTHLIEVAPHIYDPHLWMDPYLWSQILASAAASIADAWPDCRRRIQENWQHYARDLRQLDQRVMDLFAQLPVERRVLITSHDAFSYFGRRYDLQVMALQGISTDRQISVGQVDALVERLIAKNAQVVFTESSVSRRDMRAVIEGAASRGWQLRLGGTLYSDAMGAEGTAAATYIGMFEHNVRLIADSFDMEFVVRD